MTPQSSKPDEGPDAVNKELHDPAKRLLELADQGGVHLSPAELRYVASSVADLEAENERLKVAGEGLADAIRGLDSYAAGSFPAPLERTERADAALKAWAALHPEPTEENE